MTDQEEVLCITVNDGFCKKTGITGKFINNETISVYGYHPIISTSKDVPSKHANSGEVNVHHLSQYFILDDPILRSLVAESSTIYQKLQSVKEKATADVYLQSSRTYRSAIRSCLNKLQDEISNEPSGSRNIKQYENYVTIFYSIECMWHLCEFLLIDRHSTISVVPNLLEWTKFHFPTPGQNAGEMLINMERDIDVKGEYWPTVRGLILQGQIDIARGLLRLHSSSETATFQLADKDLDTMPVFSCHGGLSLQKFRSQWQYWATAVESKINSGLLATEPELEVIMKLITGDKRAWNKICKESECWYEYFAGFLYFTQPASKYFELGTFANNWLSQWASSKGAHGYTNLKHLDRMILSVLENDMAEMIHGIQNLSDNKWFVTHLTDLLVHCDQLRITEENNSKAVVALRESLVFDFGTMLMSRGSLWEIGLDYLESSSPEGIGAREMLLSRIPIKNEIQAMRVINVARKCGLSSVETEVCRVMVKKSLSHVQYGNALEWAIRSRDNVYVTNVANIFLQHYCNTGEMMCKDLLANVGAKMFLSPRLLFLIKYFDFHQFYRTRAFSQAAELLVNLLDSKIIPEFFWPSLLADTIPLLEHNEPIIPTKETYIILHHLESDLVPFFERQNKLKEERKNRKDEQPEKELNLMNGCTDDLVELLRLACARNLSRAMIIENTLIR
ncbi:unnamed protein product [Diamesa hyperborea]